MTIDKFIKRPIFSLLSNFNEFGMLCLKFSRAGVASVSLSFHQIKPSVRPGPHALFLMLFLLSSIPCIFSQQWELNKKFWYPDGEVKSIVHDTARDRIYIGGDFQTMGPVSPYGAQLNYITADRDIRFVNPDNDVRCVISDGKGGWYIGGDFARVGDSLRGHIAHINDKGQVTHTFSGDSFDQRVSCLMLKDSILYIGGAFKAFGKFRHQQAIFDSASHKIDFRFPLCNGTITASISDKQGGWYVAGNFTSIGDSSRHGLAYIESTGKVNKWNPAPDSTISEMVLDGTTLYVAGLFSSIGGSSVYRLAAVHYTTGRATSWNASVGIGSTISKMLVKSGYVYVGGIFTSIGGASRSNLAALSTSSGSASSWNPNVKGLIKSMVIVNSNIYIAGDITTIGSTIRRRIGCIGLGSGAVTTWNPQADNTVNTIQAYGQYIIAGGLFQILGTSTSRKYLAAIDTGTGIPSTWNPSPSAVVSTCLIEGQRLYIGGSFTSIAGLERNHFALYNMKSAKWDAWYLVPPSPISLMAFSGRRLFVGGFTGQIGDIYRNGVASYNVNSRKITGWNPLAAGICTVASLVDYHPHHVIIGGQFTQIGGKARNNIARLNTSTGIADTWNPNASASISCMQLHKDLLYVSGTFASIGGLSRNSLAALDTSAGQANTTFVPPSPNASINVLMVVDSTLFMGGRFQFLNGINRNHCASLNARTGALNSWDPNVSQEVFAMGIKGNSMYLGGKFEHVNSPGPRPFLAELVLSTGRITQWNPLTNDVVYALALGDSNMYVGGHFYSTGRKARKFLAAMSATTGQLLDWGKKVDMNDYVSTMMLKDTVLYMGGAFLVLDMYGKPKNRFKLAALGTSNANILAWNPKPYESNKTTNIYALAAYGNKIYVAGEFPSMNSVKVKNLAALDPVSGNLVNWNTGVNKPVRCLFFKDTTLYIGGYFDSIYGRKRPRAAALSPFYPALRPWNPVFNNVVIDLKPDSSKIYAAGDFDSVNNTYRGNFALLDNDSGDLYSFNPDASANNSYAIGNCLELKDSLVYLAGYFISLNKQWGNHLASVSKTTGSGKVHWEGEMEGEINKILLSGKYLFAGGSFRDVAKERVFGFAVFNPSCKKTSYLNMKLTACAQFSLNGVTYNKTGLYRQIRTNMHGCDSFINIDLKIRDSSSKKMTVNTCGPYVLNSQTYTVSGSYLQKRTNYSGCDSIIYLSLTITPKTQTIKASDCSSYTLNGQTYTATGVYTQNLKAYKGCDSLLTLDLKILAPPSPYTIQASGCDSLHFNGIKYMLSGTYTQKTTSYGGCDSFIVLNLNIFKASARTMAVSACQSYVLNGQTYNASGSYEQKLKNYRFCDSILTLQLKISGPTSGTIQAISCAPYLLNGQYYTSSGTYTQKKQNYLGCDSNITLNFTRTYIDNAVSKTGKTLTAVATGHTYQWVDCNNNFTAVQGETKQSFTPLLNGSYAVILAKDGCDSLSQCYEVQVTGISKNLHGGRISVYPNPIRDKLQIQFEGSFKVFVKLSDLAGKTILQTGFEGKSYIVDLSGLNSGMYLLSLTIDGENIIYRVVKE
jgi:hypothetical protein